MLKIAMFLYVMVLVVFALLFTLRNDAIVAIDLIALTGQARLAFVVIGAFAIGSLFGVLSMLGPHWSMRRQLRKLRRIERQQSLVPSATALPQVQS